MPVIPVDIRTGSIKRERIIGIDLGTTNSLVSYMHGEHPAIIANKETGDRILPSIVYFDDDFEAIVGKEAMPFLSTAPERTVYSVKRLLGKNATDIANMAKYFSYNISSPESERMLKVKISNGDQTKYFTPIEVSGKILKSLKQWAEDYFEEPIEKAVITVPAYFNDAQRTSTKQAGKLAGLDVIRIINEPTAASLAYGLDRTKDGYIVVYDMGGGTFDVSVLKLDNGVFDVLSTNGDTLLGGDDIDSVLLNYFAPDFEKLFGFSLFSKHNSLHKQRFRVLCEKLKKELSEKEIAKVEFPCEGKSFEMALSREKLKEIILPVIEKTRKPCLQAISDANLSEGDISKVVLVGGTTRMPIVKEFISELFKSIEIYDSLNPDEAVALGAGVQAGVLSGQTEDVLLLDVNPLTLGIETVGSVISPIIPRNSKIPTRIAQEFTTSVDNQTGVEIHILQGEREFVKDNRSLGKFTLKPIPPMPAGAPRIRVTFELDQNSVLTVSAKDMRTEKEQSIEVKPTYGLTDEEVEESLASGFKNAEKDIESRLLAEATIEAESVYRAIEKSLVQHSDVFNDLDKESQNAISNAKQNLRQVIDHPVKKEDVQKAVELANQVTMEFARKAMNKTISKSLRSKNVHRL